MKFKVGDKVRIRQWKEMAKEFGLTSNGDIQNGFIKRMNHLCGRVATISELSEGDEERMFLNFYDKTGDIDWFYSFNMIEPYKEDKNMALGTMEQRTKGIKRQAWELIELAYKRGFDAGVEYKKENYEDSKEELIEQGRNEAWEAVRKVILNIDDGGLNGDELKELFDTFSCQSIIKTFTASETIESLRIYEEQKKKDGNKFNIGDEVVSRNRKYIVTSIKDDPVTGLTFDGFNEHGCNFGMDISLYHKTGRTFHEIAELFEKIKND